MKIIKSNRGMGLVDLVLGSVIFVGISLAVYQSQMGLVKSYKEVSSRSKTGVELMRAYSSVMKVGRLGQECERMVESGNEWLQCRVDPNSPPTADESDDATFRFGMQLVNGTPQFQWQKLEGLFKTYLTFDNITQFRICDDDMMAPEGPVDPTNPPTPCLLSNPAINAAHAVNLGRTAVSPISPTPAARFFRFELKAKSDAGTIRKIQGSFSVRHPASSGLVYKWVQ